MASPTSQLVSLSATHPVLQRDWSFREDCGLSQIVDVLATLLYQQDSRVTGPTAGNEVYRNLQYLDKIASDPSYASMFASLDVMGTKLYTSAQQQVQTLKQEITQYVEKLSGLIRTERDTILAKSGIDSIVGEQRTPIPLTKFNWSGIECAGGIDYAVNKVAEATNLPIQQVTSATLLYVAAKWKNELATTLTLAAKDADKLYEVYSKSSPTTSRERFNTLLGYITDPHQYRVLLGNVRRPWSAAVTMDTVHNYNTYIHELVTLHAVLTGNMEQMLSDTVISKFQSNLQQLQLLCCSMCMYLHYHRHHTYSKSIVLDATTMNSDTFEEIEDGTVTTTDEDTGDVSEFGEEDVMKYVRVHHTLKKVRVPNTGISLQEMLKNRKFTERKLAEHTKSLASKLHTVTGQATSAAMYRVLSEMITHKFTSVDVANRYRGMLPKYLSMVQDKRSSIEEVLYQYFLDTDYKDTKLGMVYQLYRAGISDVVSNESNTDVEFTSEVQGSIEQKIVVELSVDFLKSLIQI